MEKATIIHAVDMLHYLPLFIAHQRSLQQDFNLELAPLGDREAIERLMSFSQPGDFCLCDPMMVNLGKSFSAAYGDWPVVIGQIVQKVPFWAVDHKEHNFADEEQFASFDQIFSYPEPNTGYVFGKLIYERARTINKDLKFRPEKQIDADLQHYLSNSGTVVLEADILKITKFTADTTNDVVFSFPLAARYQPFCFTAVLTRRNYLRSPAGQARAHELITALRRSVYLIYNYPDLALEIAMARFGSKGFDKEIVERALRALSIQEIFSPTLVVSRHAWRNSIEIQRRADSDFNPPSFKKFVDCRIAQAAEKKARPIQPEPRWLGLPPGWVRLALWSGFGLFLLILPIFLVGMPRVRKDFLTWPWPRWLFIHLAANALLNSYLWIDQGFSLIDERKRPKFDIGLLLGYMSVEALAIFDLIPPGH